MIKFETLKVILPILLPEEQIEMAVFIYLEIYYKGFLYFLWVITQIYKLICRMVRASYMLLPEQFIKKKYPDNSWNLVHPVHKSKPR